MEQGRVLIAIALSFAVFFLWNFFFVEKPEVKQQQPAEIGEPVAEKTPQTTTPSAGLPETSTDAFVQPAKTSPKGIAEARTITVKTPLYTVRISETGAVFKSFELEQYREHADKNSARKNLLDPETDSQTMKVSLAGGGAGRS
jgi:YidC/Oxa1 family membrane protein insertase